MTTGDRDGGGRPGGDPGPEEPGAEEPGAEEDVGRSVLDAPDVHVRQPGKHGGDKLLSRRFARWVDERLGTAKLARLALGKVFPDHWSFLVGEVALYSFLVLIATGVYLTFFYNPSTETVIYHGSYEPLQGVAMSLAYKSALDISFDVRAGLVMRQIHHWAALLFVAAIVVHLMRIFFTGAFRRPRELNWVIGLTLFVLAFANGFMGYSLLDDQLSGTGLRIMYGVVLSIPLIGTWIGSLLFGGNFPGENILGRLYSIHILLIPAAIAVLLVAHLAIMVRQKHTQFEGPRRANTNVVGEHAWPSYAAKALGLLFCTAGVLCVLGGLVQINAVWLYGPFRPAQVSSYSQPDWYMGWLEGALRVMPGWEIRAWGYSIPNPFYPAVLMPTVVFILLYLWPFIEARVTGDHRVHHVLDRPRTRPARTGFGVAALTFFIILTFGGASDVISTTFSLSVNTVVWTLRILLIVLPFITGRLAWALCRELCARDGIELPEPWRPRWAGRWRRRRRAPVPRKAGEREATAEPVS